MRTPGRGTGGTVFFLVREQERTKEKAEAGTILVPEGGQGILSPKANITFRRKTSLPRNFTCRRQTSPACGGKRCSFLSRKRKEPKESGGQRNSCVGRWAGDSLSPEGERHRQWLGKSNIFAGTTLPPLRGPPPLTQGRYVLRRAALLCSIFPCGRFLIVTEERSIPSVTCGDTSPY